MYRLHKICHIVSTYWSFLIYEPFFFVTLHIFCSFFFYTVGSSVETYLWCCNWMSHQWVFTYSVYIWTAYCMFIYILFDFLFTELYHHTCNSQRICSIWSAKTQSEEVFMLTCLYVHTCEYEFIIPVIWCCLLAATSRQNQIILQKNHPIKLYYLEQGMRRIWVDANV